MNNNLEGKHITVFVDGGFKVSGLVELDKKDRMGLVDEFDDSIYIILKSKISMIRLTPENTKDAKLLGSEYPASSIVRKRSIQDSGYNYTEENQIGAGNQYGSILPSDMLNDSEQTDNSDDFSISWGPTSSGRVEVTVDSE